MSTKWKGETPQDVKGLVKEQKTYCLTFSIPARLLNQLTVMGKVFVVLVVSGYQHFVSGLLVTQQFGARGRHPETTFFSQTH